MMEEITIFGSSRVSDQLDSRNESDCELYVDEVLTGDGQYVILDMLGSVSGLRRDETVMIWNEDILDEQYRRFLSYGEV